jgi:hypothetical protein
LWPWCPRVRLDPRGRERARLRTASQGSHQGRGVGVREEPAEAVAAMAGYLTSPSPQTSLPSPAHGERWGTINAHTTRVERKKVINKKQNPVLWTGQGINSVSVCGLLHGSLLISVPNYPTSPPCRSSYVPWMLLPRGLDLRVTCLRRVTNQQPCHGPARAEITHMGMQCKS